ncbi:hypothetical protein GCM10028805_58500 [Spirosoma harenae]
MKTLLLLCLPLSVAAQENILPEPIAQMGTQPLDWKVSIAITLPNWPIGGPTPAIKTQMEQKGWGASIPAGCTWFIFCDGPTNYPEFRRSTAFDLEFGFRRNANHGFFVGIGVPQGAEITGRTGGGALLSLKSKIWYASFRWAWYSQNGRFVNSVGPACMVFEDYELSGIRQPTHQSQMVPALHLSSQFRCVNRRSLLLALKFDVRVGPSVDTQQYEMYGNVGSYLVRFKGTDLSLTHANIGLQLGFKFRGNPVN